MPAARRNESNAMLYTLIAFVGLFIVATTIAVIYYLKSEDQRTKAERAKSELGEMVTNAQWLNRGNIVGTKKRRETYLGNMVEYLDQTVSLIIGGPLKKTTAEVKVNEVNNQVNETLALLAQAYVDFENVDPNTDGLIRIMTVLKDKFDDTAEAALDLNEQLEQLQNKYDRETAIHFEREQKLAAEKKEYEQEVDRAKKRYDELEVVLRQSLDMQAQTLLTQRNEAIAIRDKTEAALQETSAKLAAANEKKDDLQNQLWAIMPPPDSNVPAYKPDGQIMSVYDQIVHLNIGSDDRVYRGLTFSVYNKGMPIPKDGRGKAEIEVFDVRKNVSLARVIRSQKRRPIVVGDIVANLIWASYKTNVFAVVGEFDLNSDGAIDDDAHNKIKQLIEKWGGKVAETISVETDFLLLGTPPQVLKKPTPEEIELDPMATEKYEAYLQKLDHYDRLKAQAKDLWVPVFSTERFLYFTGYKALAGRPDAF